MPMAVSSTPNCARMPAEERLDEPLPMAAFSKTVTREPRSARRTAVNALVEPPPITTTWSAPRAENGRSLAMHWLLTLPGGHHAAHRLHIGSLLQDHHLSLSTHSYSAQHISGRGDGLTDVLIGVGAAHETRFKLARSEIDSPLQHRMKEAGIALGVCRAPGGSVVADRGSAFFQEVQAEQAPHVPDLYGDFGRCGGLPEAMCERGRSLGDGVEYARLHEGADRGEAGGHCPRVPWERFSVKERFRRCQQLDHLAASG